MHSKNAGFVCTVLRLWRDFRTKTRAMMGERMNFIIGSCDPIGSSTSKPSEDSEEGGPQSGKS